jgi:hypothetical protein
VAGGGVRLAVVTGRMLSLLPAERVVTLADGPVTIDLDTTDVEVSSDLSLCCMQCVSPVRWAD